ncbi:MAG TPA: hypothetical protein VNG93_14455 [Candidatus Dormibacteraeota bacterium]|nr:hypothetical protein [Candidatus Dormibacteraeota bacterium]
MPSTANRPTGGRPAATRRTGSVIVFTLLLAAGLGLVFGLSPSVDVALAAGAAWIVTLLLVVAGWDLLAMATRSSRYMDWLPQWPLPRWLDQVGSSFVMVAFFYGIVVGHFFWR